MCLRRAPPEVCLRLCPDEVCLRLGPDEVCYFGAWGLNFYTILKMGHAWGVAWVAWRLMPGPCRLPGLAWVIHAHTLPSCLGCMNSWRRGVCLMLTGRMFAEFRILSQKRERKWHSISMEKSLSVNMELVSWFSFLYIYRARVGSRKQGMEEVQMGFL